MYINYFHVKIYFHFAVGLTRAGPELAQHSAEISGDLNMLKSCGERMVRSDSAPHVRKREAHRTAGRNQPLLIYRPWSGPLTITASGV